MESFTGEREGPKERRNAALFITGEEKQMEVIWTSQQNTMTSITRRLSMTLKLKFNNKKELHVEEYTTLVAHFDSSQVKGFLPSFFIAIRGHSSVT